MLPKELRLTHYVNLGSKNIQNYNISHSQFIRKRQFQQSNTKTFFSNKKLKANSPPLLSYDNIIRKKLSNQYSSRKLPQQAHPIHKRTQNSNPYRQAVEQSLKFQDIMLCSLQKSFKICKKPLLNHKESTMFKENFESIRRSKTALSLRESKSEFQENIKNYEKIVLSNPQQRKINQRLVKSALFDRPQRSRIKNLSVVSDYLKSKSSSESRLC